MARRFIDALSEPDLRAERARIRGRLDRLRRLKETVPVRDAEAAWPDLALARIAASADPGEGGKEGGTWPDEPLLIPAVIARIVSDFKAAAYGMAGQHRSSSLSSVPSSAQVEAAAM